MTTQPPYTPIDCGDYDFIEVACLYQYQLEVVLQSSTIRGKAITTKKDNTGEFLILEIADNTRDSIRADEIVKLIVLDKPAKFSEHTFKIQSN